MAELWNDYWWAIILFILIIGGSTGVITLGDDGDGSDGGGDGGD